MQTNFRKNRSRGRTRRQRFAGVAERRASSPHRVKVGRSMAFGALKRLTVGALLAVGWGAAGCQQINSTDVRTSGVYAELSVTTYSTTEAEVDATLWAGGALSNT